MAAGVSSREKAETTVVEQKIPEWCNNVPPSTVTFKTELRKKTAIVFFPKNSTSPEIRSALRFIVTESINTERKAYALAEQDLAPIFREQGIDPDSLNSAREAMQAAKLFGCQFVVVGEVKKIGKVHYLGLRLMELETEKTVAEQKCTAENEDQLYEQATLAAAHLFDSF